MIDRFLDHVKRFIPLSVVEEQSIANYLEVKSLKRKDYLLSQGDTCTASYFVQSGCLRMYFLKESGQEQITHFALENWWLNDQLSLELQQPTDFFIQAVEDSEVAILSRKNQEALLDAFPRLERYFRIVAQRAYGASQRRIRYLYYQNAEERYNHFAGSFPGFVQRVPQYMLASYLNITPEVVSKIKAKSARGKK